MWCPLELQLLGVLLQLHRDVHLLAFTGVRLGQDDVLVLRQLVGLALPQRDHHVSRLERLDVAESDGGGFLGSRGLDVHAEDEAGQAQVLEVLELGADLLLQEVLEQLPYLYWREALLASACSTLM